MEGRGGKGRECPLDLNPGDATEWAHNIFDWTLGTASSIKGAANPVKALVTWQNLTPLSSQRGRI